jgi:sulfur transfer complex TusBCD TusB component (DsrH family)
LRKILYLLKEPKPVRTPLLLPDQASDTEASVILLQDGVTLTHVPTSRVYALVDDVRARNIAPSYPGVSYADMLRMMFEADVVIAL